MDRLLWAQRVTWVWGEALGTEPWSLDQVQEPEGILELCGLLQGLPGKKQETPVLPKPGSMPHS